MDKIKAWFKGWINKQYFKFNKAEKGFILEFSYGVAWASGAVVLLVIIGKILI